MEHKEVQLKNGEFIRFRPLQAEDGEALGDYFEGLSAETRRRYGPHLLDRPTARQLCAAIDPAQVLRMVAVRASGEIIAYYILVMGITEHEQARYEAAHLPLDPLLDCTAAPSVADTYQNQGLGTPLMLHLIELARTLGRRWMVLMGGTQMTNTRAIRFYEKCGFEVIGQFEYPEGVWNQDMRRIL